MTAQAGDSTRARGKEPGKEPDEELFGFIEKFSAALIAGGFPPMPARVFAALHVADSGRLTAAELVDILQISPAAVSGAVRYLSGLNLLLRERVPGSRREHYRMPADIWQRVMRSQTQVLHQWVTLLKEGTDLVGPDTQAGQRMAGHAGFFAFLTTEIPAVYARWEEQKDLASVVVMRYLVHRPHPRGRSTQTPSKSLIRNAPRYLPPGRAPQ
jgi:DNA-binding transcriptional regulator GbsR (MarR family)